MKRIRFVADDKDWPTKGTVTKVDSGCFDFVPEDKYSPFIFKRQCHNDGTIYYLDRSKLNSGYQISRWRWKSYYYPKSHKTTLYSIWFLGRFVGKDVARLIGRMVWESRYDFIWE